MQIKNLVEKRAKNNKTYLHFEYGDKKVSCWEELKDIWGLIKGASVSGEEIELQLQENKGYWNCVGMAGVQVAPRSKEGRIGQAVARKEAGIEKHTERKENSITEAAIRRDAAMFAATRLGTWKEVEVRTLQDELEMWTEFFEKRYR